jgi:NADH-quinone oxidoreductase subunit J
MIVLAVLAGFAALMVVFSVDPIKSALWTALCFLLVGAAYVAIDAELIGAIQVIVYAGAVMVLFLFVMMSMERERVRAGRLSSILLFPVGIVLMIVIGNRVWSVISSEPLFYEAPAVEDGLARFANLVYGTYLLPTEVVSVLLLGTILGATYLARKKTGDEE